MGKVFLTVAELFQDLTAPDGRMLTAVHLAADAGHVEVLRPSMFCAKKIGENGIFHLHYFYR